MKKICDIHGLIEVASKKDRCPKCKKQHNKNYTKNNRDLESQKVYQSTQWREVRKKALLRDSYCCTKCNKVIGMIARDHVVDHIIEIKDGGSKFDLENLQTLCQHCHNIKTRGGGSKCI